MKKLLKWILWLSLGVVLLFVVFLLSLDTILRIFTEQSIQSQTGLKAEIGSFHLGLREPVITIKDFKLHNPAGFGDTLLVHIRELHAEYDRDALATNRIHVNLLRFDLGELDIVKSADGKTNLCELGVQLPTKEGLSQSKQLDELKAKTGIEFGGIDTLKVSVGTFKYIDLGDPKNNREQAVDIQNQIVPHVNTPADLTGLVLIIGLRSGDFFGDLVDPGMLKGIK